MKPFRVNGEWVYYAHGPGSESDQPLAKQLVDMIPEDDSPVMLTDPVLVREVKSVAELYTSDSNVQSDDRLWFRGYPRLLIRRCDEWLKKESK